MTPSCSKRDGALRAYGMPSYVIRKAELRGYRRGDWNMAMPRSRYKTKFSAWCLCFVQIFASPSRI